MIRLFPQGWEEIPYDPREGNTTVDYYLMTALEGGHVVNPEETVAFAYSADRDVYFQLEEEGRLFALQTVQEVDDYVVASFRSPTVESIVPLDDFLSAPYKEVWLAWHRITYCWMYE